MSALINLRKAPETPLMVGLLVCVLFTQALLPLPVHTRIGTDTLGNWTLVCTWLDKAPGEHGADTQQAPGIVFSSLGADLLSPDLPPVRLLRWFLLTATRCQVTRFDRHEHGSAHRIRGPPQTHGS